MKSCSILFLFIFHFIFQNARAFEVDKIDIENHPQESFPVIQVNMGKKSAPYYGYDSSDITFQKKEEWKIEGEIPLSGYIFAKEFVESFRIPKTLANKKDKNEFIKIFSEKDPGKLVEFILQVNEKKRTAKNDAELEVIKKKIAASKTDDIPESTHYFPTGFIELKSPQGNNERYFIQLDDIKKANLSLNADKTKVTLLKSITVYSFQNVLSGLNFGDIEKGSSEDLLYAKLERNNLSLCGLECQMTALKDLNTMALNVGKIVNFEVVANDKIADMDDFNKYIFAQQWCLLQEFNKACSAQKLTDELKEIESHKIISDLIIRHKSKEGLCKFLQK